MIVSIIVSKEAYKYNRFRLNYKNLHAECVDVPDPVCGLVFLILSSILMQVDEEILERTVTLGFDRNHLVQSLQNRIQDDVLSHLIEFWSVYQIRIITSFFGLFQATVSYYLLLDYYFSGNSVYSAELNNSAVRISFFFFYLTVCILLV